MSRVRLLGLLVAPLFIALVVVLLARGDDEKSRTAKACPAGQIRVPDREEGESSVLIGGPVKSEADREERDKGRGREREAGDYESNFKGKCAPAGHPES